MVKPKEHNILPRNLALGVKQARRREIELFKQNRDRLLEGVLDESSSIALNDISTGQNARQVLDKHSKLLELLDDLRHAEFDIDPVLPPRTDKAWRQFFGWLNDKLIQDQDQDKTKPSEPLDTFFGIFDCNPKPSDSRDSKQNCSLLAKRVFKKGDVIFKIPRDCMMTTETALKDDELGNFIRNDSIASAMQNVALVLHVLNEHTKKDKSPWYRYLNILPKTILPVLRMKKDEWQQLVISAHLYDALKMIRSISRQYTYFYKRLQSTDLPLKKTLTFRYYCWGVSIVSSRQNEIPPSDRQWCPVPVINALIPILDMCNHAHDSNQAIFQDDNSILTASKPIEEGEEIKINYGTRTSGEFYIHNGFVPDVVNSDMIPIYLSLNQRDSLYPRRVQLLKILNMPSFGRFKLVEKTKKMQHRRDPHLTMFLIVYLLPEDDLEMILQSDNPVGLADDLYERVQYANQIGNLPAGQLVETETKEAHLGKLLDLGRRISELIEQYSSKRASIAVALINDVLQKGKLDASLATLFEHERKIYESYIKTELPT